jgi:hypothetical protein
VKPRFCIAEARDGLVAIVPDGSQSTVAEPVCPQCHRTPSRDCTFGRCKADEPRDTIEAPPVEAGRSE